MSGIDWIFTAIATDLFAVGFLAGLVIFLVGLFLAGLFCLSRMLGYRTPGTVVGAVEVTRIKHRERDGEQVEKIKRSLYPVYEYTARDGSVRRMRGSEGGTMVHAYQTGQGVSLIVREDEGYDDVYDADLYGALYLGLALLAGGVGLMAWVGSMAAAFGVGVIVLLLAGVGRVVTAIVGRKKPAVTAPRKPYSKAFDPADLKPVEEFQRG